MVSQALEKMNNDNLKYKMECGSGRDGLLRKLRSTVDVQITYPHEPPNGEHHRKKQLQEGRTLKPLHTVTTTNQVVFHIRRGYQYKRPRKESEALSNGTGKP